MNKFMGTMLFCASCLWATNPSQTLSVQGLLLQNSGQRMSDGTYSTCFRLYDATSGGNELWKECDSVQVSNGFYQARLGETTALPLAKGKPAWVEVEVSGEVLQGRVPLTGAAYAWTSGVVTDSVLSSAKLGKGLAVHSLNGLKDDVVLSATGDLQLSVSGDSVLLNIVSKFDSIAQSHLDSAYHHSITVHRMFTSDSSKAKAERTATATRDGILSSKDYERFDAKFDSTAQGELDTAYQHSIQVHRMFTNDSTKARAERFATITRDGVLAGADFARFNAKGVGDVKSDSVWALSFVQHRVSDGDFYPICNVNTEGHFYYMVGVAMDGGGALIVCRYNGATRAYENHILQ